MLKATTTVLPASIELTPKQLVSGKLEIAGLFPRGTRVYLTDLGEETIADQIEAAKRLKDLAYIPVPHFAARRIQSQQILEQRLAQLARNAGVDDILVIAGGLDKPAGPYASSLDILQTGIFEDHGVKHIAIAGHPEGSPDIAANQVDDALLRKCAYAEMSRADFRIATQFCFDVDTVIKWLQHIQSIGNTLPVHLGIAGPAKITTLIKYATMCGIGPSLNFLKKQASSIIALATSHSPDSITDPLEKWAGNEPENQLAQFHIFPFGGVTKTAEWLYGRGSWPITVGDTQYSPWNAFEISKP